MLVPCYLHCLTFKICLNAEHLCLLGFALSENHYGPDVKYTFNKWLMKMCVCVCVFALLQMRDDCFTRSCYACSLYLLNYISMTDVCVVVCVVIYPP